MAQVTVSASFRFQCRDERGRIYYQPADMYFTADDSQAYDGYVSAAYQEAHSRGLIPDNCESYGLTINSVTALAGPTGQRVTVYFMAWCVDARGGQIGNRFTLTVEVDSGADIEDVQYAVRERAEYWWSQSAPESCVGSVGIETEITSPLMYQYSVGD